MRKAAPADTGAPAAPAAPPPPDAATVYVQYREQAPVRVRGLATGRVYEFSGRQPVQAVDERDAAALLQTRWFHR